MKRLILLGTITVIILVFMSVMLTPDQAVADRPTPAKMENTFRWKFEMPDSSTASGPDSLTTYNNSSSLLFKFDAVDRYSTVHGYYVVSYDSIPGATGVIDSTQDTVWVQILTAAAGGTPSKLLYSNKITAIPKHNAIANSDYVAFNLTDSVLWDYTYVRLITTVEDTNIIDSLLPLKIKLKMYAK